MTRHAARILQLILAAALLASCAGLQVRYSTDREIMGLLAGPAPSYPAARFAVLSDTHLYDAGLGVTGKAFQDYMDDDRKLLPQSEELLLQALAMAAESGPQFLIISGDLTKDGEKRNHELMASHLTALAGRGIKTYVVPGNHDILNPDSKSFEGDGTKPEPTVTPEEFAAIYKDFGYGNPIMRDPASLSYVAEPVPGLWLLALASCDYSENQKKGKPETDGRFKQETVGWMETVLTDALRSGKAVIAVMHHGVMEHYIGQEKYYGEYIVDEALTISSMLAAYGVRVVFTGHFHAQDIKRQKSKDGKFLYDVETGSLVGSPDALRIVEIAEPQRMTIHSRFILSLPSYEARGEDFAEFSYNFERSGIAGIAIETLTGLGVPEAEAELLAPQIADAFMAHYIGDEKFLGKEMLKSKGLSFMGGLVVGNRKGLINGLWNDLAPADNDIVIDLGTGEWKEAPAASLRAD